jgi:hypothetical protein
MKWYQIAFLIFSTLTVNSCSDKDERTSEVGEKPSEEFQQTITGSPVPYYVHWLWLSFQDISGNDLVKGIEYYTNDTVKGGSEYSMLVRTGETVEGGDEEHGGFVKPELFTLDLFYNGSYYPVQEIPKLTYYKKLQCKFFPGANPDYSYLSFCTQSAKYYTFAEIIAFRLKCPYLFGNDSEHYIITYWKKQSDDLIRIYGEAPICYRIEFGDKEYEITGNSLYTNVATIIVDNATSQN